MLAIRSSVAAIAVAALLCLPTAAVAASEATLLRDIKPVGGSDPRALVQAGERVFFSANDGSRGRELWVSDGTAAGTTTGEGHPPRRHRITAGHADPGRLAGLLQRQRREPWA